MKIAFAIFKYFPYGGLQSDMLRAAETAVRAGHSVRIYARAWLGQLPQTPGLVVRILPCRGMTNHARAASFERAFHEELRHETADVTVAFDRIPGCMFYFSADNCLSVEMRRKHVSLVLRLLGRYRTFLDMEKRIFFAESATRIFLIADRQKLDFIREYGTPVSRFVSLPPGIHRKFQLSLPEAAELRAKKRQELELPDDVWVVSQIGSDFTRKGVDRAIRALASLKEEQRKKTYLLFAGQCKAARFKALAETLGVIDQVRFVGPVNDPEALFAASDLTIHPARNEAAGNVLVESLATGTPVLCTACCGFSGYVKAAGGVLIPDPFEQSDLNDAFSDALTRLPELAQNARLYAQTADFYSRPDVILATITAATPS